MTEVIPTIRDIYELAIMALSSRAVTTTHVCVNQVSRQMFREGTCKLSPYALIPDYITKDTIRDAITAWADDTDAATAAWLWQLSDAEKALVIRAVYCACQMLDAVMELPF